VNYGVAFLVVREFDVKGENAHALFKYLTQEAPITSPYKFATDIEKLLDN